jgi:hypothetical protein
MKSHQNTNDVLHRTRKNNPKIHMEAQKTPESKQSREKRTNLEVSQLLISKHTETQ